MGWGVGIVWGTGDSFVWVGGMDLVQVRIMRKRLVRKTFDMIDEIAGREDKTMRARVMRTIIMATMMMMVMTMMMMMMMMRRRMMMVVVMIVGEFRSRRGSRR